MAHLVKGPTLLRRGIALAAAISSLGSAPAMALLPAPVPQTDAPMAQPPPTSPAPLEAAPPLPATPRPSTKLRPIPAPSPDPAPTAPPKLAMAASRPLKAPTVAPPPSPHADGAYIIRFGTFADPSNATRLQAALRKAGHAAEVVAFQGQEKTLNAVQLGGFADRAAAEAAAAAIKGEAGIDGLIMKAAPK